MKNILLSFLTLFILIGGIFLLYKNFMIIPESKINNTKENIITNEFKNISYYKKENLIRYKNYKNLNDYDTETIVTNVNIGIDSAYYTNVKTIDNIEENILINKYNKLKDDFIPNNLVNINNTKISKIAYDNYLIMKKKMEEENLNLTIISAYRTKEMQNNLYSNYCKKEGAEKADTYSARPRHSEHETGLAIDVTVPGKNYLEFEKEKEYEWLKNNSYKYGFILRYPKNKTDITGYIFEPWHYRFIGVDLATKVYISTLTYDEYYIRYLNN